MDIAKLLETFGPFGLILGVLWGLYARERAKADADRAHLLQFVQKVYERLLEREAQSIRAKLQLADTLRSIGAILDKIVGDHQLARHDVQRQIDEVSERIVLGEHGEPLGSSEPDPRDGRDERDK